MAPGTEPIPTPSCNASPSSTNTGGMSTPPLKPPTSAEDDDVEDGITLPVADEETPLLPPANHAPSTPDPNNPYLGGISVPRFWLLFTQIMIAYFVACFDSTIMASSHPVITSYFGSSNSASWLSTAFLLTSTSFQPLLGGLSDAVGRKRPYVVTIGVFLVATVWCALAGSMQSFIAARALCGLGAGGMMALGSIIVSDVVPIE